ADPVRVARHHQRPVAEIWQDAARQFPVVPDQVTLGDLGIAREKRLAGVGQLDADASDGHGIGLPGCHAPGPVSLVNSRTTSWGSLSSRSPWNRGLRSLPAVVDSLNPTSPTILGCTQWTRDCQEVHRP